MRRSWIILAMLTSLVVPVSARAEGSESLGPSLHEFLIGGGVASQGVGLAGRLLEPAEGGQPGTIALTSIPAGASVVKALLYWVVLGGPDADVTFQGQPLVGTEIGVSVDSWSCGYSNYARNIAYRRDVTSLVTGNGSYAIAGVGDGMGREGHPNDAQGASLVVLYEDETKPSVTEVVIHDGAITGGNLGDGIPTGGFEDNFVQLSGLAGTADALSARLHVGFGDGQGTPSELNPGAGPLKIGGTTLAAPGFLSSTDGPLWDAQTFDVPASILPTGTTSTTVQINSGDDCIVWAYAALAIELPDVFGPIVRGIPDRPANAAGWHDGPVTIHWEARDPSGATQPPDTTATTQGRNVSYSSGESCDSQGNCATGSLLLSIDATAPRANLRTMEMPIIGEDPLEQERVRIFDQWLSGTATDDLSGISTVEIVGEDVTSGEMFDVPLEGLYCQWGAASPCDYSAKIPRDSGTYRMTITAIDRAGVDDPSPIQVIVVLPPGAFPDECPLGPLCD